MSLPLDPPKLTSNLNRRDAQEGQIGQSAATAGSIAPDARAAIAETVDGGHIEVLELRGTIIRLREQLDRIHLSYQERVQQLESMHRAQRRDLEDTIRHLRNRLQVQASEASETAADGGNGR